MSAQPITAVGLSGRVFVRDEVLGATLTKLTTAGLKVQSVSRDGFHVDRWWVEFSFTLEVGELPQ